MRIIGFAAQIGGVIALGYGLIVTAAAEDAYDISSENALKLCKAWDASGTVTAPCEVSVWHQTVKVRIDTNGPEARKICDGAAKALAQLVHATFMSGWKLKIYSPFSGDQTLAVCDLPYAAEPTRGHAPSASKPVKPTGKPPERTSDAPLDVRAPGSR
jgi:hypothetical protein